MGLLDLASSASAWRGYEYYKDGSVLLKKKITDHEYSGSLRGSGNKHYDVFIDIEHPRKSHCNCPHANGKRIICKQRIWISKYRPLARHLLGQIPKTL